MNPKFNKGSRVKLKSCPDKLGTVIDVHGIAATITGSETPEFIAAFEGTLDYDPDPFLCNLDTAKYFYAVCFDDYNWPENLDEHLLEGC